MDISEDLLRGWGGNSNIDSSVIMKRRHQSRRAVQQLPSTPVFLPDYWRTFVSAQLYGRNCTFSIRLDRTLQAAAIH